MKLTSARALTHITSLIRRNFKKLNDLDIKKLGSIVNQHMITDTYTLESYNCDWLKIYKGQSKLALMPNNTQEVSQILNYCNTHHIAVCLQGGNTGLVGGSIPVFDEVIISTKRMNKIISFDHITGILECEAGCILESLDNYVGQYNFLVPIDLGARGTCSIGGNVATNAGGLKLIKYGNIHGNLTGLEVVLADGTILDMLSSMKKDNTGYHLKNLFVGCEGTLGLITKVTIQCAPKPSKRTVAFVGLRSFESVLELFRETRLHFNDSLTSFELLDKECIFCLQENANIESPIGVHEFYILMELSASDYVENHDQLELFLNHLYSNGRISDVVIAMSESQSKALWKIRENVTEALREDGHCYKYDVAIPLGRFHDIVKDMRNATEGMVKRCVGFGHLGDFNLHLNVTTPIFQKKVKEVIENNLYNWVSRAKGSISAEHGIGLMKKCQLHYSKKNECIQMMKMTKHLFDPKGILNPYKTLPD